MYVRRPTIEAMKLTHDRHEAYAASLRQQNYLFLLERNFIMPPPRRGGALSGDRRPSSVRLSDVAYGSNSKTKRPRKTKLCTGVP